MDKTLQNSKTQTIARIIENAKPGKKTRRVLANYHEKDIADALTELGPSGINKLHAILGAEWTAGVLSYMEDVGDYLSVLPQREAAEVLGNMDADDALDALEDMDNPAGREELISLMDTESSEDVRLVDSFEDDEVGRMMSTNYITVPASSTVPEAMRTVISDAHENPNIGTIYALDEAGKYAGAIDLKDLIIARREDPLQDIISTGYPSVLATEKTADVIERLKDYAEDSIPVLDAGGSILGVITAEDVIEAVDDELGDDYAKLGGLTEEEDVNERLLDSMRKRLPWLILLLGLGLVVSSVVGVFEGIVAQVAVVVAFQSLILDMAGNAGTQSLAVTIRVLMDENLGSAQKMRFVFKEMRVGGVNGAVLGIAAFVFVGLYLYVLKGMAVGAALTVSGCVGAALFLAMLVSSLTGTVIPLFFAKIKVDPAVASGPLITTVNDLVAAVTYYGLVALFLVRAAGRA